MQQEEILKEKYGRDAGFCVPDGYFEGLNSRIMSGLPPYQEAPKAIPLTMWQKMKPYVYLAAMFAGIWVMMKVFHTVSTTDRLTLDNPPEAIVQALDGNAFEYITAMPSGYDYELVKEVSADYESIEDFEADFGYELLPEYDNVSIPEDSGQGKGI